MFSRLKTVDMELAKAFSWLEIVEGGTSRAAAQAGERERMLWEE